MNKFLSKEPVFMLSSSLNIEIFPHTKWKQIKNGGKRHISVVACYFNGKTKMLQKMDKNPANKKLQQKYLYGEQKKKKLTISIH